MAGFRSSEGDLLSENHEINVTPFIDVILVLLIIFMVAAPLSTVDVPVDLPSSSAAPTDRPDEPLFLSLQADLTLSLKTATVPREQIAGALDAATGSNRETRIYLRADEAVAYGQLMEVMNLLRAAGYLKVALVGLAATPEAAP